MDPRSPYLRWLPELEELVAIPSVGVDPAHDADMERALVWLDRKFSALGAVTHIVRSPTEQILLADLPAQISPKSAATLLVYGHFDVQPPGDLSLWDSPPFRAEVRGEWLYGRGAIDDKGHLVMYLEAARAVLARGALAVNLRFLIDGAEERAGTLALDCMRRMTPRPDGCLIFDGPMIARGKPAFFVAARGALSYHLRVHVLLRREGWLMNHKRTYRLYCELGFQLRNKTPKRRVKAKLRDDRQPAMRPNDVWAMDFLHDQLATGQKIRVLTVVDTFSRFSPTLDARISYRGEDVVQTLEKVCSAVGYPKTIRVDQGSEFVSRDLDLWAYAKGVTLDFSRPGKPTDNAFAEAFNSRVRAERMNAHWFLTLADAREKLEDWRRYYNEERPHGAIGQKPPILLQNFGGASSPSPN